MKRLREIIPLPEPLLPIGNLGSVDDFGRELEKLSFKDKPQEMKEALRRFVVKHPHSRWTPVLRLNLGILCYRDGYFTEAIEHFQQALELSRGSKSENGKRVAAAAAAQLSQMYARLGRMEDLDPLLKEFPFDEAGGSARQVLEQSKEALDVMIRQPEGAFRCGPLALARIRGELDIKPYFHPVITEAKSPWRGFSLAEVEELARKMDMNFVSVKAAGELDAIPTPSVVHWRQNHYAAILSRDPSGGYLVRDMTFGYDGVIAAEAIRSEASGYFLVSEQNIPRGWRRVDPSEAWQVYGRGYVVAPEPNATSPSDVQCPNEECSEVGMPSYSFHAMMVSLHIEDTPLAYTPPVGPSIAFQIYYNQTETLQPMGDLEYGNVGRLWGHNWLSWVEMQSSVRALVVLPGGGAESVVRPTSVATTFAKSPKSSATLVATGSNAFRRDLPDGTQQIFAAAQSIGGGYRVFLSEIIDSYGNSVALSYDSNFRLTTVTDAIGQQTTFSYADPNDMFLLTKVKHVASGREALLNYNSGGQLVSITDAIGMTSSFTYGSGDFVDSMTTPYGTTTFSFFVPPGALTRVLTSTDPLGRTEKMERRLDPTSGLTPPSAQMPPNPVPVAGNNISFLVNPDFFQYRNTFYWDKKAFSEAPNDVTKAEIYHWLHNQSGQVSPFLSSFKKPLEARVFYNYENTTDGIYEPSGDFVGKPAKIARVVNMISGTKQTALSQVEYNTLGQPTKIVDPLGRETVLSYAGNLIDLIEIKQKNAGGGYDTLFTGTYNSEHLPLEVTGANGKTTTFSWNGEGQLTSATNALSETTIYTYDGDGYLQNIDPPHSGTDDQITLTYDAAGRVATRSQWGYALSYLYDNLNRITKVTYPDNTTEEVIYEALHPRWIKDRLNRWTRRDVNAVQEVVGVLNPAAEYTAFEWCKCGSLAAIIDAPGHVTRWGLDLQGRQTSKTYADGRTDTYAYNPYSGWLETLTDAAGQQVKAQYAVDGRAMATRYLNETISTPDVVLTWDAKYPRVTSMVDGTGTTSYTFRASGTTGAGGLATVDGPLGNDTITLDYDNLGRVVSRTIDAIGESVAYDALGRVAIVTNPLDTFTMAYSGTTGLPLTITGSKGLSVANSYYNVVGDYRVQGTTYAWSGTRTLAEFGYQYDAGGRITRWDHQVGSGDPRRLVPSYDAVSRLIGAMITNPLTSAQITAESNRYDRVGNRLGSQDGSAVTTGAFNRVNQLLSLASGGEAVLQGSLNEPGTVTVGSRSTRTDADNKFRLAVPVTTGSNQLTVVSEDVNGNTTTNTATFTVSNSGTTAFSYDLNGNTTDDGQKTYSWDGANRLVKITYSGTNNYTEFTYDGFGRRVRIKEIESGTTASDKRFVWDGLSIAELRGADGTTVQRRYYGGGFQEVNVSGTGEYFYVRDHLGSVRAVVDESGIERGGWSYGLWGERGANQITSSAVEVDFGYTGHYNHLRSSLVVAPFRAYSPEVIRWLSRDPIGEAGGINLYEYVSSDSINFVDPYGLADFNFISPVNEGSLKRAYDHFNPKNQLSLVGHGGQILALPYDSLLNMIKGHPKFSDPKNKITFYICNDGKYVEAIIERLANDLGRDIDVPNGYLTTSDPLTFIEEHITGPTPWVADSLISQDNPFPAVANPQWKTISPKNDE